ncbi:MAG: hypothetical protein ACTSR8_11975 [Promethearchaeota archaeon]
MIDYNTKQELSELIYLQLEIIKKIAEAKIAAESHDIVHIVNVFNELTMTVSEANKKFLASLNKRLSLEEQRYIEDLMSQLF